MKFSDRFSAGEKLAKIIPSDWKIDVVCGIANGGVSVAAPVAKLLGAGLDVLFVSKLPLPWSLEVAVGTVSVSGNVFTDEGAYRKVGLSYMDLQKITREKLSLLKRRQGNVFSDDTLKPLDCAGKNVLIVDDGMATGFTVLGAVKELKEMKAGKVFIATPITHLKAIEFLAPEVDGLVQIITSSSRVFAVSAYYRNFEQVGDREVRDCLKGNRVG